MKPTEIARVQAYLRLTLHNEHLRVDAPKKRGASVEVLVGDEFLGTLHRDDEDGEISYSLHITILEEDLPPETAAAGAASTAAKPSRRSRA